MINQKIHDILEYLSNLFLFLLIKTLKPSYPNIKDQVAQRL